MEVTVRDEHIFTLCFANDYPGIVQNEEDLSYMKRKLKEEYKKAKLEIN